MFQEVYDAMAQEPRIHYQALEHMPTKDDGDLVTIHVVSAPETGKDPSHGAIWFDTYNPVWDNLASRIGDSLLERCFGAGLAPSYVASSATVHVVWINNNNNEDADRLDPIAFMLVRTMYKAPWPTEEERRRFEEEDEEEDEDFCDREEFVYVVRALCVEEAHRGRGLGTALMRSLPRFLRSGARSEDEPVDVELYVDDKTPQTTALCKWYTERFGFELLGSNRWEPELVLRKRVHPTSE